MDFLKDLEMKDDELAAWGISPMNSGEVERQLENFNQTLVTESNQEQDEEQIVVKEIYYDCDGIDDCDSTKNKFIYR
jgi:hypothetical protein